MIMFDRIGPPEAMLIRRNVCDHCGKAVNGYGHVGRWTRHEVK